MFDWILGRCRAIERHGLPAMAGAGLVLMGVRVFVALPFWSSGLTKWVSFPTELSASAKFLFSSEFMLHLPGGPYPMPFPNVMAWLSGTGEIVLPVFLVLGLLSRPAAFGILAMVLVIQTTVPDGWPIHIQWAAAALVVLALGPGLFSLDTVIRRVVPGRMVSAA